MTQVISGKTKVVGIIGAPVGHSLSPVMHNAAFCALGLDYIYVPFPTAVADLPAAVAGFKAVGVVGFNATVPHKVALLPLLDLISPEAELVGAVNTVQILDGKLHGYNTDGTGLLSALSRDLRFTPAGQSVLLLGAGGAARSAVYGLAISGAARITIANRSLARGRELLDRFRPHFPDVALEFEPLSRLADPAFIAQFDLVLNTTTVGMREDRFEELNLGHLKSGAVVYDMVYAPPVTPLLKEAAELGTPRANGIGMLVAQGEAAFRIWTGIEPPAGCMRRALDVTLDIRQNSK